MNSFIFDNPTKLIFGSGALDTLRAYQMPGKKALLLISSGKSVRVNGHLEKVEKAFSDMGIEYVIYDGIEENPLDTQCMAGAKVARENGCDFIFAMGGGAVLDSASAISCMATNPGDLWDYMRAGTGGKQRQEIDGLPVVCVPTTSGTASEINGWGVISNEKTKEKMGFGGHTSLVPKLAIVDPKLMLTVPQKYTAYQGMDAFFHHAESYLGKGQNIMDEALALSAIKEIYEWLPVAYKDGSNLEAREHVAYASTMAGYTMNLSGTVLPHAMEHALSAHHRNVPHGAGLILIGRAFFARCIEEGASLAQFVNMAKVMGMPGAEKPEDFLACYDKLIEAVGMSGLTMQNFGVEKSEAEALAETAKSMQPSQFRNNPFRADVQMVKEIYEVAF